MKKTKTTTTQTNARTWNKEDYYEYMDVALDAHNAAKHASVQHYANSRRKIDAEDDTQTGSMLVAAVRGFLWQTPAVHSASKVAVHKAR